MLQLCHAAYCWFFGMQMHRKLLLHIPCSVPSLLAVSNCVVPPNPSGVKRAPRWRCWRCPCPAVRLLGLSPSKAKPLPSLLQHTQGGQPAALLASREFIKALHFQHIRVVPGATASLCFPIWRAHMSPGSWAGRGTRPECFRPWQTYLEGIWAGKEPWLLKGSAR